VKGPPWQAATFDYQLARRGSNSMETITQERRASQSLRNNCIWCRRPFAAGDQRLSIIGPFIDGRGEWVTHIFASVHKDCARWLDPWRRQRRRRRHTADLPDELARLARPAPKERGT
jgi:hypothetical protein